MEKEMNKILVIGFKGMYNSSKMLVDILIIILTKGLPQSCTNIISVHG